MGWFSQIFSKGRGVGRRRRTPSWRNQYRGEEHAEEEHGHEEVQERIDSSGKLGRYRRRVRGQESSPEEGWGAEANLSRWKSLDLRFRRSAQVVAMLVLVGVVALVAAIWTRNRAEEESLHRSPDRVVRSSSEVAPPPERPEEKSALALAAVDRFFSAARMEEKLDLVFDLRVEAEEVKDYYLTRGRVDPSPEGERKVTAISESGREILIVTFRDQSGRDWAAPLEWHGTGYRLHWGAMTGYGEIPWAKFLEKPRGEKWKMRLNLYRPADQTAHQLPEGHDYVLVTHPELQRPLGALLAPDSSLQSIQLLPEGRDIPVRVEMIWQDFGEAGEWPVITSLIHRNWIR